MAESVVISDCWLRGSVVYEWWDVVHISILEQTQNSVEILKDIRTVWRVFVRFENFILSVCVIIQVVHV